MDAAKLKDHEKRKNQEGSYSLYNYIYNYLLDNFEPDMDITPAHELLFREAKAYNIKGGKKSSDRDIKNTVQQAIINFKHNDKAHGDTGKNLGKRYDSSLDVIKQSINDLRW